MWSQQKPFYIYICSLLFFSFLLNGWRRFAIHYFHPHDLYEFEYVCLQMGNACFFFFSSLFYFFNADHIRNVRSEEIALFLSFCTWRDVRSRCDSPFDWFESHVFFLFNIILNWHFTSCIFFPHGKENVFQKKICFWFCCYCVRARISLSSNSFIIIENLFDVIINI